MLSSQLVGEITFNHDVLNLSIMGIFITNLFLIMLIISLYKATSGKRT